MPTADLSYRNVDSMFTAFFANTPAGAEAWKTIAADSAGTGKILTMHVSNVVKQLRAAGYTVTKATGPAMSDDELLTALAADA